MIGVETLYTIQISWAMLATSEYYNRYLTVLSKLNYSYGQISQFSGGGNLNNNFSKLGFTNSLNGNYLILAILNAITILLYLSVTGYRFIVR
jgi:hypothetical protein